MDLRAVKATTRPELAAGVAAAARNACDLLRDAEILAEAHSQARASTLAALAVEEAGKAVSLSLLAGMPQALKGQAPVGRLLEWHQWKQVSGQLLAIVPYLPPEVGAGLLAMPAVDLEQMVSAMEVRADEADRLKRSGLYVDFGQGSRIREPSEITEAEVTDQLGQARQAIASARMLLEPVPQARLVNPPAELVRLARAAVSAFTEAGYARTQDAAADVMVTLISTARNAAHDRQIRALISAAGRGSPANRSHDRGAGSRREAGRDIRPMMQPALSAPWRSRRPSPTVSSAGECSLTSTSTATAGSLDRPRSLGMTWCPRWHALSVPSTLRPSSCVPKAARGLSIRPTT